MNRIIAQLSKHRDLYFAIRNMLGFWPENIHLYRQAFRHRSKSEPVNGNFRNSNERLEYLGDAVLGAVIAHYLFKKFPYRDEGFLTEMRSRLVSRNYLNSLAVKIGVDKLIVADEHSVVSKTMGGDSFEALMGAIYLDKGFDFTFKLILNRIIRFHVDIDEIEQLDLNFKSKIINWAQKQKVNLVFEAQEELKGKSQKMYFVNVLIDGKPYGKGNGLSKKQAEQDAARQTIEMLRINDTFPT